MVSSWQYMGYTYRPWQCFPLAFVVYRKELLFGSVWSTALCWLPCMPRQVGTAVMGFVFAFVFFHMLDIHRTALGHLEWTTWGWGAISGVTAVEDMHHPTVQCSPWKPARNIVFLCLFDPFLDQFPYLTLVQGNGKGKRSEYGQKNSSISAHHLSVSSNQPLQTSVECENRRVRKASTVFPSVIMTEATVSAQLLSKLKQLGWH